MNSKNISVRTLLPLCLVIAIAFMAMPAYAQPVVCDGCNKIVFADDQLIELEAKCYGDDTWVLLAEGAVNNIGEVILLLIVYNGDSLIFDGSLTFAQGLAKRELKLETLGGDVLEIEFKFKE